MKEPLTISRVDESIRRIEFGIAKLQKALEQVRQEPKYFGVVMLQFNLQDGEVKYGKVVYDEPFK